MAVFRAIYYIKVSTMNLEHEELLQSSPPSFAQMVNSPKWQPSFPIDHDLSFDEQLLQNSSQMLIQNQDFLNSQVIPSSPFKQVRKNVINITEEGQHKQEDEDLNEDRKNKNKKRHNQQGLKIWAKQAFRLIQHFGGVTFEDIDRSLAHHKKPHIPRAGKFTKSEKNMKRRVYDATNVAISLGILTKEKENKKAKVYKKSKYVIRITDEMVEEKRKELEHIQNMCRELNTILSQY